MVVVLRLACLIAQRFQCLEPVPGEQSLQRSDQRVDFQRQPAGLHRQALDVFFLCALVDRLQVVLVLLAQVQASAVVDERQRGQTGNLGIILRTERQCVIRADLIAPFEVVQGSFKQAALLCVAYRAGRGFFDFRLCTDRKLRVGCSRPDRGDRLERLRNVLRLVYGDMQRQLAGQQRLAEFVDALQACQCLAQLCMAVVSLFDSGLQMQAGCIRGVGVPAVGRVVLVEVVLARTLHDALSVVRVQRGGPLRQATVDLRLMQRRERGHEGDL
ncbi:hypothetical protein D3C71_1440690 [compost metagenome]